MTLEEFIDEWSGSSADVRFAAFLTWIQTELVSVLYLIGPIAIERNASTSAVSGTESGFSVDSDIFTESESDPSEAVSVGEWIITKYYQQAQDEWYDYQRKRKKWEEERNKWDNRRKPAKPKGGAGRSNKYEYGSQ